MALVSFYTTTEAKYNALAVKDNDALYFLDSGRLYKGNTLIGNGIQVVDSYPTVGETGIIYVIPGNGGAKVWTGATYVDIVQPMTSAIDSSSTHSQIPSAKAVWDAISAVTPDGYEDFVDKVAALEKALADINNASTGILAQAKSYTDELKNGQVAQNKSAIEALGLGKADKATTLAGYGIGDAYTKTETDSAIAAAVADVDHLKRKIVEALPDVSAADANTIYMILDTTSTETNQRYNEYILINGVFELIGTTAVNMQDYVTQDQLTQTQTSILNAAKEDATNKANAAQKAVEDQLNTYKTTNDKAVQDNTAAIEAINDAETGILKQAKDFANSLGANYATKEQGAKADSALQESDITTGTTAGTFNVKGNAIAIAGLKSAAYHDDTDFDAAGSAAAAEANAKTYTNSLLTWKSIS